VLTAAGRRLAGGGSRPFASSDTTVRSVNKRLLCRTEVVISGADRLNIGVHFAFALLGCTVQAGQRAARRRAGFAFSHLLGIEEKMHDINGIPADRLVSARWRKSVASNPTGSCVEMAELAGGEIAVRNSRYPSGPALIYTRAEVEAFMIGVKNGEFDDLCPRA
jgi:hypothetical protein